MNLSTVQVSCCFLQSLSAHLAKSGVTHVPISSPPVLAVQEDSTHAGIGYSIHLVPIGDIVYGILEKKR